jgi:uroporphyrinogen-III synthase
VSAAVLSGRRVVVTRARVQAAELVGRLTDLGATVIELPAIAIDDPLDGGAALEVAAHRLASGAYQWVALTSSNAVVRLVAALGDRSVPPSVRWAAVGGATARALDEAGMAPVLVPEVALSEALAAVFPDAGPGLSSPTDGEVEGGTVLFPRAEAVRAVLAPGLRSKGWLVDEVVAYRTVAGRPAPDAVAAAHHADVVVFSSPSTVQATVDLLSPQGMPALVVSIGPVTSDAARATGLAVAAEADPHTAEGLVAAVVAACRA